MAQDPEAFLSRWSRLKREEAEKPPEPVAAPQSAEPDEEAPPLPPVEDLTPESDFTPFMQGKVPPETRRAALKKLFADPQFNVPDPYEAYSEDWTVGEAIPLEMLKTLNQAKRILYDELPPGEAKEGEPAPQAIAGDDAGVVEAPAPERVPEAQPAATDAGAIHVATKEDDGGAGRQDTQGL